MTYNTTEITETKKRGTYIFFILCHHLSNPTSSVPFYKDIPYPEKNINQTKPMLAVVFQTTLLTPQGISTSNFLCPHALAK